MRIYRSQYDKRHGPSHNCSDERVFLGVPVFSILIAAEHTIDPWSPITEPHNWLTGDLNIFMISASLLFCQPS
jgi:hypothetical protein